MRLQPLRSCTPIHFSLPHPAPHAAAAARVVEFLQAVDPEASVRAEARYKWFDR